MNYSTPWDDLFYAADRKNKLPLGYTKAISQRETGHILDPQKRAMAVSPKGAGGLMQFMPETGAHYGLKKKSDFFDPVKAIDAGGRHLGDLWKKYRGNPELVAAAFNAGEPNVDRYKGIPPFAETQKYVPAVMRFAKMFSKEPTKTPLVASPSSIPATTPSVLSANGTVPYTSTGTPLPDILKAKLPQLDVEKYKELMEMAKQEQLPPGYGNMGMAAAGAAGAVNPGYQDMTHYAEAALPGLIAMIQRMKGG